MCALWAESYTVLESLCLLCLVMFDWDIIYHRQEISSLYLWETACSHQTVIMTSVLLTSVLCVCHVLSGLISVWKECVPLTIAGLWDLVPVWVCSTYVCVCAHTPLLPRLLNYEAFTAVVMASSAFGNMSFYFCLGPNIQFEEGSQTIHGLFKKSNEV